MKFSVNPLQIVEIDPVRNSKLVQGVKGTITSCPEMWTGLQPCYFQLQEGKQYDYVDSRMLARLQASFDYATAKV